VAPRGVGVSDAQGPGWMERSLRIETISMTKSPLTVRRQFDVAFRAVIWDNGGQLFRHLTRHGKDCLLHGRGALSDLRDRDLRCAGCGPAGYAPAVVSDGHDVDALPDCRCVVRDLVHSRASFPPELEGDGIVVAKRSSNDQGVRVQLRFTVLGLFPKSPPLISHYCSRIFEPYWNRCERFPDQQKERQSP
jgi:hypothetical protein